MGGFIEQSIKRERQTREDDGRLSVTTLNFPLDIRVGEEASRWFRKINLGKNCEKNKEWNWYGNFTSEY